MPTLIYTNGFENGIFGTSGGGIWTSVTGTLVTETSIFRSGSRSAKLTVSASATGQGRIGKSVAGATLVARLYVRFEALPGGSTIVDIFSVANSPATSFASVCYNPTTGKLGHRVGTAVRNEDSVTITTGVWYRVDFRSTISGGDMVVDSQVDGRAVTQSSVATTATSQTNSMIGTNRTDHTVSYTVYYDDFDVSATSGDYPLGAGKIAGLSPNADGTHNAGTNVMEDASGVDIGVTAAWSLLDDIPLNAGGTTDRVQQSANGSGNYAEIQFANLAETPTSINGVMGYLAYLSASATANNGSTYASHDNFTSSTAIFGTAAAPVDMSESTEFYKTAMITAPGGGWTKTAVDGLKMRIGNSTDTSPAPWWTSLIFEVSYVPPAGGQSAAIGLQTETDSLLAAGRRKIKAGGLQTETDSLLAANRSKARAAGLQTETDSLLALARRKVKTLGILTETDSLFTATAKKSKATGLLSETDTLFAVSRRVGGITQIIGILSEADSLFTFTRRKTKATGLPTETDSLLQATRIKRAGIGIQTETDSPLPFLRVKRKGAGLLVENDSVFTLGKAKVKALGLISEADSLLIALRVKRLGAGILTETNSLFDVSIGTGAILRELLLYARNAGLVLDERGAEYTLPQRDGFALAERDGATELQNRSGAMYLEELEQ